MGRFTHAEYEERQQRARDQMSVSGLDGLLLTEPSNLFYFTGYPLSSDRSFARPAILLLPSDSPAVLVVHQFHFPCPWQGQLKIYDEVGRLPLSLVVDLVQKRIGHCAKIGAEIGFEQQLAISPADFDALRIRLKSVIFEDASRILWSLRNQKTEAEISNLREACFYHDLIFEQCFSDVRVGMGSRDIEKLFEAAALDIGGKNSGAIVCIGPTDSSQVAGSSHPDRLLEQGDLCWIDFSLGWNGYRTDYCRASVVGGPSRKQSDLWNKVNEILLAGFGSAMAGNTAAAIARVEIDTAMALGLDMDTWLARRYGHGSGIRTTEPPSVSLTDETRLVPGMVIHLEPGVISDDGIYVREEMILVTESEPEWLSKSPWKLGSL